MVGFLTIKLDAVLQVVVGVVHRTNPSQVRMKGLQSQHRKVSKNSVLTASRANQIVTGVTKIGVSRKDTRSKVVLCRNSSIHCGQRIGSCT